MYIWTLDFYQEQAMRTNGTTDDPIPDSVGRTNTDINYALLNATLGACGESGELADDVKKALFHGKKLDRDHAIKELGDILWYVAQAATALNVGLSEVARLNIEKLKLRYPEGFSHEASARRADGEPMPEKEDFL